MRKGGFRNQAKRQQVRNKEKFNFRKQQIQLKEQMNQAKNYNKIKK
tara:strand:+ start:1651 stop:1788 length:138 start_codon:yes stop_codon:yes gene_type:complete